MFEFDKSMDNIYDRSKVFAHLQLLFSNRKISKLLVSLMESGVKINIKKLSIFSEIKTDAYCKPGFFSAEIGFLSSDRITFENLLHELLHLYAYIKCRTYTNGNLAACEEYEVRVLTDLIIIRDFNGLGFKYQGMNSVDQTYFEYKEWLQTLINASSYNPSLIIPKFKIYGVFCTMNLPGFNDNTRYPSLNTTDFNYYTPLLLATFWQGF